MAVAMLALKLGGTLGNDNRKKMNVLLQTLPAQMKSSVPSLQNYEKASSYMDKLGDTYVSPQLFVDTQTTGILAATVKGCGFDKDKAKQSTPKLISTKVSKAVTNPVFLPSNVSDYSQAYLVSGKWEEEWQYEVCEQHVLVTMVFVADGLGGATFFTSN